MQVTVILNLRGPYQPGRPLHVSKAVDMDRVPQVDEVIDLGPREVVVDDVHGTDVRILSVDQTDVDEFLSAGFAG